METLIIDVEKDRLQEVKDFLIAMNVKFRNSTVLSKEKTYNPEFVEMVKENRKKYAKGEFKTLSLDEIWK